MKLSNGATIRRTDIIKCLNGLKRLLHALPQEGGVAHGLKEVSLLIRSFEEVTYTEEDLIRDLTAIHNDLASCESGDLCKSVYQSAAVNAAHDLDEVLTKLGAPEVSVSSQRTVSLGASESTEDTVPSPGVAPRQAYDAGIVVERTVSHMVAQWKHVRKGYFDAVAEALDDHERRDEVLRSLADHGTAAFTEGVWAARRGSGAAMTSPPPPSADVAALALGGGYVPSDDHDPAKLADYINERLRTLRYYDGETALDGPYLLTPFRPWYDDVIYSPCTDEAQGATINMLLQWNTQTGDVVSDLLPPYPGRSHGWRWDGILLGSQWVVSAWLTNGAVAVQAQ